MALFCCIPDADTSLNYLVGMIYTQLFQTLYYVADRKYGGRLPIPVNCIMDEWPNVALPDDFEKILSTCRSRSIFCSIIVQNMSQIKALFKDSWESLVGNCDELLYLGGNEKRRISISRNCLERKPSIPTRMGRQKDGQEVTLQISSKAEGNFSCRMKCVCWITSTRFYLSVGNAP